jgi:uncharacterized protein
LFGVAFQNNTGATLSDFTISFTGEQWRTGGTGSVANTLAFEYKTGNAGSITISDATGWNAFTSLDYTTPAGTSGTGAAINPPTSTTLSGTLSGLTVNQGQQIWLRWRDINDSGNDNGMAIDDFSATPVPEPTTIATGLLAVGAGRMIQRKRQKAAK